MRVMPSAPTAAHTSPPITGSRGERGGGHGERRGKHARPEWREPAHELEVLGREREPDRKASGEHEDGGIRTDRFLAPGEDDQRRAARDQKKRVRRRPAPGPGL